MYHHKKTPSSSPWRTPCHDVMRHDHVSNGAVNAMTLAPNGNVEQPAKQNHRHNN
jgi:hypothetical protein